MNDDQINSAFLDIVAAQNGLMDECASEGCPIHNAVDATDSDNWGPVMISYVGDYFVITSNSPDVSRIAEDDDLMAELQATVIMNAMGIGTKDDAYDMIGKLPVITVTRIINTGGKAVMAPGVDRSKIESHEIAGGDVIVEHMTHVDWLRNQ